MNVLSGLSIARPTCLLGFICQHAPDNPGFPSLTAAVKPPQSDSQGKVGCVINLKKKPNKRWPQSEEMVAGLLWFGQLARLTGNEVNKAKADDIIQSCDPTEYLLLDSCQFCCLKVKEIICLSLGSICECTVKRK